MKTLLLLRHGKAERYNEDSDRARALADRGVKDSRHMGRLIAHKIGDLDLIVASDAARASQTARLVAEAAGYKSTISFRPEIYAASSRTLLDIVRELPKHDDVVLMVGHNPGMEELADDLAGPSDSALPTAGLIVITLPGPWSAADVDTGKRVATYGPGD
ncbi:MAG: histidine phosphatase family protein [Capsulimonadaceae bacterium]|nr:histidine phosphatase family protein [Capsulimonadaceae bacterium]